MNWHRALFRAAFAGLILALTVAAAPADPASTPVGVTTPPPASAPITVTTKALTTGSIRDLLAFTGETRPFVETFATADLSGRIERILVENGDAVAAGQVVVTIERERYQIALDQAEAALRMAEQRAREARSDFERTKVLFERKAVNDKTFEAAETAAAMAASQVKQAQAAFDLAKLNLEQCNIRAAIAGYFVNRTGFIGQGVNPGTILGKVVELKRLFVEARIPEHQIRDIAVGQACLVEDRTGRVAHIDLYADSGRGFLVKILVPNDDLHFKANMFVKGFVVRREYANVPLLPLEALLTDEQGTAVFVVEGGRARRQPVEVMAREGTHLYAKGVAIGQAVVVVGQHTLRNGDAVVLAERP